VDHVESEEHRNVQPRFLDRRFLDRVDPGRIGQVEQAADLAAGRERVPA
jgi:hypothetical protein